VGARGVGGVREIITGPAIVITTRVLMDDDESSRGVGGGTTNGSLHGTSCGNAALY
jgi:hypothetical protein